MSDDSETQPGAGTTPPADLKALGDRLIGTWKVSGEAEGESTWEWLEGGFFLIQRGWTRREGTEQRYLQIIGYDRMPGSELPMRSPVASTRATATRSPTRASSKATP